WPVKGRCRANQEGLRDTAWERVRAGGGFGHGNRESAGLGGERCDEHTASRRAAGENLEGHGVGGHILALHAVSAYADTHDIAGLPTAERRDGDPAVPVIGPGNPNGRERSA